MKSIWTMVLAAALAGLLAPRAFAAPEGKTVGKEVKDGKKQDDRSPGKPPESPNDHDKGHGNDDKAQHDNGKGNDDKPGR